MFHLIYKPTSGKARTHTHAPHTQLTRLTEALCRAAAPTQDEPNQQQDRATDDEHDSMHNTRTNLRENDARVLRAAFATLQVISMKL